MKALQLQAIHQVALIETPIPQIQPDEILVRTGAGIVCTSDLADIRENPFNIDLPVVFGHEGAGVVVAVGKDVQGFQIGDRVATHPVHPCGKCQNCLSGLRHLCSDMGHFGINRPGTFAEYYPVRSDRARVVSPHMPFTQAALAEPVSVCLEALHQARLPEKGRLLILGDGPFGVMMSRLAQKLPLQCRVIAGWMDFRLGYAMGTRVNTAGIADPMDLLLAQTGGAGYDAVILAVSSQAAFQLGLRLLRPKGRMVVFSAIPGDTPVNLFDVHVRELEIIGACNDQELFDQSVQMLEDPDLGLGEMVTHTFPLTSFHEALDLAANGREHAMKVAFTFEGV